MNWQEVCDDPLLRNLPYKIELNEWGQVLMSPASNFHGALQMKLGQILGLAGNGGMLVAECSIQTSKGVKAADVAWVSDAFLDTYGMATPYPKAPELCIEIKSPSNSQIEMQEKRELYFARGAVEVWLCDEQGSLSFYDCAGSIPASRLFPGITRVGLGRGY